MARLFWKITWIFGAGTFAGLALWATTGDATSLGRYTGYAMPWILAGLIPAGIAAALARRWALAAFLGVPAAAILALHAPSYRVPPPRPAVASGPALVVLSWNTWATNDDVDRIARLVAGQKPDVALLQEIEPRVFRGVVRRLRELDPGLVHDEYDPDVIQGAISRFPLEARPPPRGVGLTQHVVVCARGGPIDVFNVHIERGGGWRHKRDQLAVLLAEVDRLDGPVIVAGDFNSPERSEPYRLFERRLANAHEEAGRGLGLTFPTPARRIRGWLSLPSLVRIDHVFHDRRLVARRAETLADDGGSDHRPIVAELELVGGDGRSGSREARVFGR